MELLDLYDKDRRPLNRIMYRGQEQPPDTYRLLVHVCIFGADGRMLIQRRQPFKDGWSDMWDFTAGGSAIHGECSQMAAERETMEEIGCCLALAGKRPALTIDFDKGFDDYYLVNRDLELSELTLQYEEVREVRWASCSEILSMIEDKLFIPYHKGLIELLFYLRDHRDTRVRQDFSVLEIV